MARWVARLRGESSGLTRYIYVYIYVCACVRVCVLVFSGCAQPVTLTSGLRRRVCRVWRSAL